MYNDQELALLAEYEKNWPEVAAAETLRRRAEYQDIFKFVFTEVAGYVQPLFDQMKLVGNTIHEQQLQQLVPDYSASEEEAVAAWVETQPSYLQAGMKQVMKSGTSDEVADLIGRYRVATGTKAPTSTPTPAPTATKVPEPPAKTELSSVAKQAAESLAPVSSERSAVPQGEETQDFETAFAKFAAADGAGAVI